ncbi:hypothetical protein BJ742DRAFT_771199 [Cladochytrium replicatum]|nr:hypothetical protein BJ742DRAFT_771199 [Cladochytrium replicatum]
MPSSQQNKRPVRIANFSGFLGDRFSALADAVRSDPPVDVVMGDYLAELTVAVLISKLVETVGLEKAVPQIQFVYSRMFLQQLVPELKVVADKKIKVVTNAGAFNPHGLALAIRKEVEARKLPLKVAYVDGDNLMPKLSDLVTRGAVSSLDEGTRVDDNIASRMVAANAYLGGWGIAEALRNGADIVVTGRVADASLVTGPAAWWHGWKNDEWCKLAGAVAAGHIIECGPQSVGGNFSGFAHARQNGKLSAILGFPIAEVEHDGSCVITKRSNDAGIVTVDTVTAQFMYETQGPRYLNPDVILHIETVRMEQIGPDRVKVHGSQGSPPPITTKLATLYPDGYWGLTYWYATGIDIDEKISWMREQLEWLWKNVGGPTSPNNFDVLPLGRPAKDPKHQGEATVVIRIAAAAPKAETLRKFNNVSGSLALGSVPGFSVELVSNRMSIQPRVEYYPGRILQALVPHRVTLLEAEPRCIEIPAPPTAEFKGQPKWSGPVKSLASWGPDVERPLGDVIYARVGDKGGNANVGVWTPRPEIYEWLVAFLTEEKVRELLEIDPRSDIKVHRYVVPNIQGLQFVLERYFGVSGSGSIKMDPVGKALGEFLRSRIVSVPKAFVPIQSPKSHL